MSQSRRADASFRDPQPAVERIAQLADRVLGGDIVLPKFQREFVWTHKQIRELLDSVSHNYPIGSLLLWQSRQELASERTIAGLDVDPAKPDYPVNYLLDGQQRLSTICGALYWEPNGDAESRWNLAYDLDEQQFIHLTSLGDPPIHLIPLRLLSEPESFFTRTRHLADNELDARAQRLYKRFNNYMVAVVTLRDMSIEEVAPVFERINSTGTELTVVDLMRAATWSTGFDLRDAIDEILAGIESKGYGKVDRKTVLRAISAAAGYGFSTDEMEQLRELTEGELRAAVVDVERAAKRAVDFLSTQIKTPTAAALPYLNQFAVLVEIFRRVPKPSSAQYGAVRRWFWRTVLAGYFGGWNKTQMDADQQAIADFASGESSEIDVSAVLPSSEVWRRSAFHARSALSKVLALLLSYEDPLDLRTGQRIDVGKALAWQNDKEFHHFFPRDHLKRQGLGSRVNALANIVLLSSISNIWISNQPPEGYLRDLCGEEGEAEIRRRLASCLVSEEAFAAAQRGDYDAFLRARAETLHQKAMELAGDVATSVQAEETALATVDGEAPDPDEPVDRDSAD